MDLPGSRQEIRSIKERVILMIKKIIIVLLIFPISLLFADNFTSGELVYFEGEITIQRNNEILTEDDIDIGDLIEEYDMISTGNDGYAEVMVESSVSNKIVLKIEPDSNLYFSVKKTKQGEKFNLKLLSGNIFAKVDKLVGRGSMDISAKSAVMGIRGTELYITTAPDDSILVTCPEGKVSCKAGGREVFAGSGDAAELLHGQPIKSIPLSDDIIEQYRGEWADERERIFRSMSFSIVKPSAIQYENLLERFEKSYKELVKHRKVFEKYMVPGKKIMSTEIVRDKITVSPAVINMRSVFYRFEQQFYRIEELKRYHDEEPVKGKIRKKYDIKDFMKDYGKQYKDTRKKLAFTRAAFKYFTLMEPVGPGTNSLMDDIFNTNPLAE